MNVTVMAMSQPIVSNDRVFSDRLQGDAPAPLAARGPSASMLVVLICTVLLGVLVMLALLVILCAQRRPSVWPRCCWVQYFRLQCRRVRPRTAQDAWGQPVQKPPTPQDANHASLADVSAAFLLRRRLRRRLPLMPVANKLSAPASAACLASDREATPQRAGDERCCSRVAPTRRVASTSIEPCAAPLSYVAPTLIIARGDQTVDAQEHGRSPDRILRR